MSYFFKAGRFLLEDLLSTLFFVGLFALTRNIYLATGVAIAVGLAQAIWTRMRGRSLDAMQILSLALVIVMGGATLVSHDPRFVMVKPTLVLGAVGAVMLRRGWMNRYLPPIVQELAPDVGTVFGYVWAGLMFATAAANLALAFLASPTVWAWFMTTVPLVSKILLFLIQFAVMRLIARRRYAARRAAEVVAAAA
ncbi:MAG: intracellular septation protein [Caulobacter sp.]|nr:intracellular septation protein [Caulobacter sp.]